MLNNTLISGIYLIYFKWDRIWFENKLKNESFTLNDIEVKAILLQHFDINKCEKILESIYKFEKIIIDFDNNKISKVVEKDMPFIEDLQKYFSSNYLSTKFNIDSRTIIDEE